MSLQRRLIKWLDRPGGRALLGSLASRYARAATRKDFDIRHVEGLWVHTVGGYSFPTDPDFRYFADSFARNAGQADDEMATATDYWFRHYRPHPGDIVVDIGAGCGEDALAFSRAVGDAGRVIAVEAHPSTFKRLELFCRLNRLANVEPLQLAIMGASGSVSMVETGNWEGRAVAWSDAPSQTSVRALTVDELCAAHAIPEIALLKMNIEGAERDAILGMRASIAKVRTICVACHDFRADRGDGEQFRTRETIERFLANNGFTVTGRRDDRRPFVRDHVHGFRPEPGR